MSHNFVFTRGRSKTWIASFLLISSTLFADRDECDPFLLLMAIAYNIVMYKTSEIEWLAIKQCYAIGYKFSARIAKHRPYGSFVAVKHGSLKAVGSIEIVQSQLYRAVTKKLPYDYSQRPSENSYINCIVCYYTDYNYQLGLDWLTNK